LAQLVVEYSNTVPILPIQKFASEASATPDLRILLRRCSPSTYAAACAFRQTRDPDLLPAIIFGLVERYVDRLSHSKLQGPAEEVRLSEDLGLDSLSVMELVVLAEDTLQAPLSVEEPPPLHTLADLQHYLSLKLR
jgi:3-hydroxyacyl-[acyl-carrier-protein] dehydratase